MSTASDSVLAPAAIRRSLAVRDLTDPAEGHHAIQLVVDEVEGALSMAWNVPAQRLRANPVVPVADNYDRLGYPRHATAREARYSRYVNSEVMLRSHTTAMIPPALERLAHDPPADVLLSCPGITYRRDTIDRHHVGEPHQIDLWRVRPDAALGTRDLREMIRLAVEAVLPGRQWRTLPSGHTYTTAGQQIDVRVGDRWVEVGECGLAHPRVLTAAGWPAGSTGLAMGLGLDRLLMLCKSIDDIRHLRSTDPRVEAQMHDLEPYRPVATTPPAVRDLSIAVADTTDGELLGDQVREALGDDADLVEEVVVLTETPGHSLVESARDRLGLAEGQKNVLLRVRLRALDRTLSAVEANAVRDRIVGSVHIGARPV